MSNPSRPTTESERLFAEAQRYLVGGVNSGVRAFRAVGGTPRFITRGAGSRIWDADGNEYIDCLGSWGPLILGHAPGPVVKAVQAAVERGTSFGAPTELEIELGRMIVEAVPSVEIVRLVTSGTEAVMSAIRLARGYTGRDLVVKFEGCYHGHSDAMLVKAGSGVATLGLPDSPGVPAHTANQTLTSPYNDPDALSELMAARGSEVACIITEPVAGNMGVMLPQPGFLECLRELATKHGALLIFDEVITGFRVGYGGAQAKYGVTPDLTTLGKIIGGGFPVGAYGGRREIMEMMAPLGPVYQAGTLSGNPVAVTAGIETLKLLQSPGLYDELERKGRFVAEALTATAASADVELTVNRVGSMFTTFFTPGPVTDYRSAAISDRERYARFFHAMLDHGVYLAPSQMEAAFLSAAHSDNDLARITQAAKVALSAL